MSLQRWWMRQRVQQGAECRVKTMTPEEHTALIAHLKEDAIEVNGGVWDPDPHIRTLPYPLVWVDAPGRPRIRALQVAHTQAREFGPPDQDVVHQWMGVRPLHPGGDGLARLTLEIAVRRGPQVEHEGVALWFPLPALVQPLSLIAAMGGIVITADPPQLDQPLIAALSVRFGRPVKDLQDLCASYNAA